MGSNILKVAEFEKLSDLKKEGKKKLKEGALCANRFIASEYAYHGKDGNLTFCW